MSSEIKYEPHRPNDISEKFSSALKVINPVLMSRQLANDRLTTPLSRCRLSPLSLLSGRDMCVTPARRSDITFRRCLLLAVERRAL